MVSQGSVFISYVRADEAEVHRLASDLQAAGANVWLDRKGLQPGQTWKRAIRHAIHAGTFFIACFSEAYTQRSATYMNEELLVAIDVLRQKPMDAAWLIPVRLSPVRVPDYDISPTATLADLQFVDMFPDWQTGIAALVDAVMPNRRLMELAAQVSGWRKAARIRAIEEIGAIGNDDAIDLLVAIQLSRKLEEVDAEDYHALLAALKAIIHEETPEGRAAYEHWRERMRQVGLATHASTHEEMPEGRAAYEHWKERMRQVGMDFSAIETEE